jgi:hypothetical protein
MAVGTPLSDNLAIPSRNALQGILFVPLLGLFAVNCNLKFWQTGQVLEAQHVSPLGDVMFWLFPFAIARPYELIGE